MSHTQQPAGAMHHREIAIRNLNLGMRLAAQLPHRLDDLGDAAAVDRMVVAQPAAIRIPRQFADARNQVAVGDELAAFALFCRSRGPSSWITTVMVKLS